MITKHKLDRLNQLYIERSGVMNEHAEAEAQILTQEIEEKLKEISDQFAPQLETLNKRINELTDEIKAEVIAKKETIKGEYLQAVFSKPRTTWDTKGLNGYAVSNPEINRFKKIGKPSVSIRVIKK